MRMLGWNLGLALVWCALSGNFRVAEFALGFGVGYLLIGWLIPSEHARGYLGRPPRRVHRVPSR